MIQTSGLLAAKNWRDDDKRESPSGVVTARNQLTQDGLP